ncbi:uncharacterized protein EI90DRAFT_172734 [Cantharellus anzutake]|uniref:uncharacterized protein n=1 Tax=Cantharellus anzutake TaxID=1750568 RepID=UPI0019055833|nr:uncharacterized protein EI90DRAFT_172734 [Cantharellus anzutake]KAF8336408.1 hypothetical protein EI90DRAFT_172734 [Cantharellus anzutake]
MFPIKRLVQSSVCSSVLQRASTIIPSGRLVLPPEFSSFEILFFWFAVFWFSPATFHGYQPYDGPLWCLRPHRNLNLAHEGFSPQVWNDCSMAAKNISLFAWHGYEVAFGSYEFLPTSFRISMDDLRFPGHYASHGTQGLRRVQARGGACCEADFQTSESSLRITMT